MTDFNIDFSNQGETKKKKKVITATLYLKDNEKIFEIIHKKIVENNNLSYSISDIFSEAVNIAEREYELEIDIPQFNLKAGRKYDNTTKNKVPEESKQTTIYLEERQAKVLNAFLHKKVMKENKYDYKRADLYRDLLELYLKNNK